MVLGPPSHAIKRPVWGVEVGRVLTPSCMVEALHTYMGGLFIVSYGLISCITHAHHL
jgi:hypothetical protein